MNNLRNKITDTLKLGLAALVIGTTLPGCNPVDSTPSVKSSVKNEARLEDTVLQYIASPEFRNTDFTRQFTGTHANLEVFNLTENTLYFSIPQNLFSENTLESLLKNPKSVEFGKSNTGELTGNKLYLGNYSLRNPGNLFFRTDAKNFKANPAARIEVPYRGLTYDLFMNELHDFYIYRSVYGGKAFINVDNSNNTKILVMNHGAAVAKPGESSLTRFVNNLTSDYDSNDIKSQKLLDFVTTQIEYNENEANRQFETMKRPNEVLMSGNGDCSNKVILYSSLLNQVGIDHRLVYFHNHIAIAVEQNTPRRGGQHIRVDDKVFSIAETTIYGFRIGGSLGRNYANDKILYLQKPGDDFFIDAKTGNQIK